MQQQEQWRRLLMRTEETASAYEAAQQKEPKIDSCRLCTDLDTTETYTHWRLMPNRFPYDRHFSKSDMLVTLRHTDERGLTNAERAEFIELKQKLGDQYDIMLENLPKQQSIPHHYHVHLGEIKRPK